MIVESTMSTVSLFLTWMFGLVFICYPLLKYAGVLKISRYIQMDSMQSYLFAYEIQWYLQALFIIFTQRTPASTISSQWPAGDHSLCNSREANLWFQSMWETVITALGYSVTLKPASHPISHIKRHHSPPATQNTWKRPGQSRECCSVPTTTTSSEVTSAEEGVPQHRFTDPGRHRNVKSHTFHI